MLLHERSGRREEGRTGGEGPVGEGRAAEAALVCLAARDELGRAGEQRGGEDVEEGRDGQEAVDAAGGAGQQSMA